MQKRASEKKKHFLYLFQNKARKKLVKQLGKAGWKAKVAENGRTYYYHVATRQTQWKRPLADSAPARSASDHDRLESLTLQRLQEASRRQAQEQALVGAEEGPGGGTG